MKPEKYRRGKALRVFWVDSTENAGWHYGENPPVYIEEVVSLGWVASTSDKGLNLTTTISERGGTLSLVSIPWEAITDIQDIPEWGRYDEIPPGIF